MVSQTMHVEQHIGLNCSAHQFICWLHVLCFQKFHINYPLVWFELELELENGLFDKKKIQTWHNITQSTWQYVFFVGRTLQRRWAHRLHKGHPWVLQCINRHCTMKGQTFGSVGKLNTHTSWDRAPSRLNAGHTIDNNNKGKRNKKSLLNTTSKHGDYK